MLHDVRFIGTARWCRCRRLQFGRFFAGVFKDFHGVVIHTFWQFITIFILA